MTPERSALIRSYAEQGVSQVQVCRELGISAAGLSQYAKRHGLKFVHGTWAKKTDERADAMADLYRGGQTLQQIGDQYGITRERVRQLMTKYHGIRRRDGGQQITKVRHQIDRETKRDARYLARCGCTWAQYCELRALKKPLRAFIQQRSSAGTRGIGWDLNLWQWWTIWQDSGHWNERGRGQGYAMCRKGDTGPYAIGNVFIAPCFINSSERPQKRSSLPIGITQRRGGFVARRRIAGKSLYLGFHPTVGQASAAYWAAGA